VFHVVKREPEVSQDAETLEDTREQEDCVAGRLEASSRPDRLQNHPRLFVDDFSIVIPVLGRDKLVMIWNYRHAIQGWELELPAGHIEDGESPEACARRELEEETGYSAGSWKRLGWFHPSPGLSSQRAYVHLARNLKAGSLRREPYEVGMEVKILNLRDAYKQLWRGEIVHSPTASALGIAQPRILRAKRATVSRRN